MPNTPIKPPNKRVDELTTEITLNLHESFDNETQMIDYLVRELATKTVLNEEYEKIINEFKKE
jgi:hypothetical protein